MCTAKGSLTDTAASSALVRLWTGIPGVEAPAAVLQLARELSEGDAAIDIDTERERDDAKMQAPSVR
jgi:hypothetical protein